MLFQTRIQSSNNSSFNIIIVYSPHPFSKIHPSITNTSKKNLTNIRKTLQCHCPNPHSSSISSSWNKIMALSLNSLNHHEIGSKTMQSINELRLISMSDPTTTKKKNLILNNTKIWIEVIWETQKRKEIIRGKKVTVIGFGSEVAIGAKGEAFSGCEQKLLPHLCDCAYAERERV